MPFDGTSFRPERPGRERRPPSDNLVTVMIVVIAFLLIGMPISLAGLADLVRYFRGS